jgi:phospholipase C
MMPCTLKFGYSAGQWNAHSLPEFFWNQSVTLFRPNLMLTSNTTHVISMAMLLCTTCAAVSMAAADSCPYQAGQRLLETFPDMPRGTDIPIDHIIVVMQENRSFDHYFYKLPEYGQPDAEVAPGNVFNLGEDGKKVYLTRASTPCPNDEPHYWNKVNEQIAGGAMSGFATAGGAGAMTY